MHEGGLPDAGGVVRRRALLWMAALAPALARAEPVRRGRVLQFPRDHGAHPDARIEWWYATGWIGDFVAPTHGFQLTFFRSRTGLAADSPSRFAPRQLLFAHAAVTELGARRHRHAQRIARWSGAADAAAARASTEGTDLRIGDWTLVDDGAAYTARLADDGFAIELRLHRQQPPLLQGDRGFSRKGPLEAQASHYVTEPQLRVDGTLRIDGRPVPARGLGWLDHEWSDQLMPPEAVGWDWIGINLADGSALTAFQLRRADGRALWAGGSFRATGGPVTAFGAGDVVFSPGRTWTSPTSSARYPVQWSLRTPAGEFEVRSLMDAQELDSRASTGTIYWEGLSELRDRDGRRVGLGYLEMTGYAGRLRL